MEYPTIDELIDDLSEHKIIFKDIKPKNQTYTYGYVIPEDKEIVLNYRNNQKADIDTVSHELMHLYFDHKHNMNLPEQKIEELGQTYLAIVPGYEALIKGRLFSEFFGGEYK